MRILVTGSRDWPDESFVWGQLDNLAAPALVHSEDVVVAHGKCPTGGDKFADNWGRYRTWLQDSYLTYGLGRVRVEPHPADWRMSRTMAGRWRNQHMVNLGADICVAFLKDHSPGTTHCLQAAAEADIPIKVYYDCTCHEKEEM